MSMNLTAAFTEIERISEELPGRREILKAALRFIKTCVRQLEDENGELDARLTRSGIEKEALREALDRAEDQLDSMRMDALCRAEDDFTELLKHSSMAGRREPLTQ